MPALSTPEITHAPPAAPPAPADEALWTSPQNVVFAAETRRLALTNFAGRNYPACDPVLMANVLGLSPAARMLTVYSEAELATLPTANADFVQCMDWLAQTKDPQAACAALMRLAPRGFLEVPSPLSAFFGAAPELRWLVSVENSANGTPTLVFRRRTFTRVPFRHALRGRLHTDADFRFLWESQYRNVTYTQFAWEGEFAVRVENGRDAYDPEDSGQRAEACLDLAIQALRFGGVPENVLLENAIRAATLAPDKALAQNTLGCALWVNRRTMEAVAAFRRAASLDNANATFRQNASLLPHTQNAPLQLELLPPSREDREDISENFAGRVFYAFVNYDDRLAQDMGIRPGERVLDVGGGQRPLKRADVSIDFDVFEGLHRQGQQISRDKPLVCGDVQKLPFHDKAFDAVCCRMVLEHVLDPAAACAELQRVGKRGFLETPNTLWECFYGHPTHRWLVEWEAVTRTLVFRRKPFDTIPFHSAIVPFLYTQSDIQRAFEVTFRNITTTQVTWDEAHPFAVRVEGDTPDALYDYLNRAGDATRGSLSYARDLLAGGLPSVAVPEAEDAVRHAPDPVLRRAALTLRLEIAQALQDYTKAAEIRSLLAEPTPNPLPEGKGPMQNGLEANSAERETGKNDNPQRPTPNAHPDFPPVVWNAPLLDPSGYADEARQFLFALAGEGWPAAARELRWSPKLAALSTEQEQVLHTMLHRPAPPRPLNICHILGAALQRNPLAKVNIGRTMFETDRLPADWTEACNRMDVLWLPSEFNRQTFTFAGVQPEKIRVVPGTIDLTPYEPNLPPLQIAGAKGFNFLSLFDWTLRKGWDVLLQAYVEEFRREEDVALIIKTHSSLGYSTAALAEQITRFLTDTLGRDMNRIPDIILQDTTVPEAKMPNLYRAADCYVMPTRGEGWGRPFMQSLAMGVPCIATNWSGQTAFLTDQNSYLLDYDLVDVPETAWRETPTYQGHRWAEPSLCHLRTLLRRAFEDRAELKTKGQQGRADLDTKFSYKVVAALIREELERLR